VRRRVSSASHARAAWQARQRMCSDLKRGGGRGCAHSLAASSSGSAKQRAGGAVSRRRPPPPIVERGRARLQVGLQQILGGRGGADGQHGLVLRGGGGPRSVGGQWVPVHTPAHLQVRDGPCERLPQARLGDGGDEVARRLQRAAQGGRQRSATPIVEGGATRTCSARIVLSPSRCS